MQTTSLTFPKNILGRSERLKRLLGFDDRLFVPTGIFIMSFLIPMMFFGKPLESLRNYSTSWMSSAVYCSIYWLAIRAMMLRLRGNFPSAHDTPQRLLRLFPMVVLLIVSCETISTLLANRYESFDMHKPLHFQSFAASGFSAALVILIYEVKYLFVRYRNAEVLEAQLRQENIQSQLDVLKSQVNPHFLFNSLNTLIYMIPEDPDKAVQFVHRLSKTYRNILQFRNETLITLEKELENLQDYLYLQKQRFQNNLSITIEVDKEKRQYWIVPLSVQMLIENAIKHNILSKSKPLYIDIKSNGDTISVSNNLQRKQQNVAGTKLGLSNIRTRYEILIGASIEILETDKEFKVVLPLIQNVRHADSYN